MGLGGPVWHASGKAGTTAEARAIAERALAGVGDPTLGEWEEISPEGSTVHIRRRLTEAEMKAGKIRGVRDVRGTAEARVLLNLTLREVPPAVQRMILGMPT